MSWPHERKPRSWRVASKADEPGLAQAEVGAGGHDVVVDIGRELGGDEQLPAELAGERDAERPGVRPGDLDAPRAQEWPRLARYVLVGQPREQLA